MSTLDFFCAKNRWKKHQIFEKEGNFENRPSCKGYAHAKAIDSAKFSVWVKNEKHIYKMSKAHAKNISISTVEFFCAKNLWKKHQLFEKWDDFENRPSCKGYNPCRGYSLCKMVSLGQKLKCAKTCEKHMYKHTRVFRCKKLLEGTPNIREMRRFWKSAILRRL